MLIPELRFRAALARVSGRARRKGRIPTGGRATTSAARLRYTKLVRDMSAMYAELVRTEILPALPGMYLEVQRFDSAMIQDFRTDSFLDLILQAFRRFGALFQTPDLEGRITNVGIAQDAATSMLLRRQFSAILGVEAVLPTSAATVRAFVDENVDLVTSLYGSELSALRRRLLQREIPAGTRIETLTKMIEQRVRVTRSKARLLASDQVLRLHGRLTEAKQKAAGVEEYRWDSSGDERVRPRHRELNGTIQRWDDPPIVDLKSGRRAHPGQDYRCRCNAIPVLPE